MDPLIARLGLALAIGLLVGLERGWQERDAPAHSRTAGIRTFGISGLLGGVLAALADTLDSVSVLVGGFIAFAAIFAWYKAREAAHDEDFSVTAVIAGLGVFALGALSVAGDYRAAAAGGTALAAVLASREILHGLLKRLTWIELRSALILAVMTAIVLPLLPNRTMDPWGGFNPWEVWFLTVLMASISFAGYVAVRVLGTTRGLLVSSLAGAIVSSTAVTMALARNATSASSPRPLAGAASLAAMVSVLRVCAVVLIVEPSVFAAVGIPAIAASLVFAACGAFLLARAGDPKGGALARNPFELGPLLLFALLFAVVATASAALAAQFGGRGLLASSTLAGTFDVDVSVLSALRLVKQSIPIETVGQAVLAALAANAVGRLSLAVFVGPVRFWLPLAGATLIAAVAGYGAMLLPPIL
ncbi:MgtC/SapB family protein [Mesorhizobium sp.]|uniref:MgtC/SapB family protein n=1 Tax=Mesorhizobium sp. TaxID=1871066 RepID=UPI0012022FFB|nr:MgtC/SapB family protein [Mesorhizobium sp.]TIO04543.1 MAG: MgtC/SapB family protein [Mesorhizobium sp.]TIO32711.1 MAG: MgtC/SapB family protein [Mesorhizobium sp.]TIP13953.1 MAG: MgtC/SapB family protein [Mesorhizobium sp.]